MTNPTPLSPAAQAVLDAYWDDAPLETGAKCGLAAALRAAANQVTSAKAMLQLCAIADELEGAQ